MTRAVFVEVVQHVDGWHAWRDAPDRQAFLRERHRHTFVIRSKAKVVELDREIECFDLKDRIEATLSERRMPDGTIEFGAMSCEAIALMLCERCNLAACEVMEDGMQGASVHREEETSREA